MSGQPTKTPSDVIKFREAYMDALEERGKLDDENLQANKIYKATGALPAKSSMPDTRTTSEILADVEKTKVSLIADLKPLMSANHASELIQRLQKSPLNSDGSLFVFFAQRAPEFVIALKKMYKYGIKGDSNDIENFISFIEKSFSMTKGLSTTVRGYFDKSDAYSGISHKDIDKYNDELRIFRNKIVVQSRGHFDRSLYNEILRRIEAHLNFVDSEVYKSINEKMSLILSESTHSYVSSIPKKTRDTVIELLFETYKKFLEHMKSLPSISSLYTLYNQFEKTLPNKNPELSNQILFNIVSLLPTIETTQFANQLYKNAEANTKYLAEQLNKPSIIEDNEETKTEGTLQEEKEGHFDGMTYQQFQQTVMTPLIDKYEKLIDNSSLSNQMLEDFEQHLYSQYLRMVRDQDLTDQAAISEIDKEFSYQLQQSQKSKRAPPPPIPEKTFRDKIKNQLIKENPNQTHNQLEKIVKELEEDIKNGKSPLSAMDDAKLKARQNTSLIGEGLPKKRRGRPKGSGIKKPFSEKLVPSEGIKPKPKYVSFGRYYINHNKLNDGIFSIRQKSGAGLPSFPSKKLSPHMTHIIKIIVGNGMPSYNDIDKMTDEERNFLHQVARKSNIDDILSIPSPSKDKMEKDINQFEIMKGEIMAGNDSKELIKKFKILLLRLSKVGTLPKNQVSEIMTELLEMGY
jgi:hypothetical protein